MKVTILLCTYNRCEMLRKALLSVSELIVPEAIEWEVLVVDNNSRDRTRDVVEEFCALYPGRYRYLFEASQGKSHALNAGIRATTDAEILAFMDDDVEVDKHWLHNLVGVFVNGPWSGMSGRIRGESSFVPPEWMETTERYALAPLAFFDLGADAGETREPPFGTNMAFRREMFQKYGNFRTDLGPRPGGEIRNEDTEFGKRLLEGGERFWYEPTAVVFHPVARERVQKAYFLKWWLDKARADIMQNGIPEDAHLSIAGVPLFPFLRVCAWTARGMLSIRPGRRFSCKLNAWKNIGAIKECRRVSRMAKTQNVSDAGTAREASREG